jgi:hypothetical protein
MGSRIAFSSSTNQEDLYKKSKIFLKLKNQTKLKAFKEVFLSFQIKTSAIQKALGREVNRGIIKSLQ